MGRKRRQSGYSSSQKAYRSVIARASIQRGIVVASHSAAPEAYHPNLIQQPSWGSTLQSHVQPYIDQWRVPQPENSSPVGSLSALSYHNPSLANSATTGPTAQLEYERRISPDADTPTSSIVSFSEPVRGHQWPLQGGRAGSLPDRDYSMTDDVIAGIDDRDPNNETAQFIQQPAPKFISNRGPSPSSHKRHRLTNEPWALFQYPTQPKVPSMDVDMQDVPDHSHHSGGREKGGGRTGPLSQAQRQQASDVRRMGACLRCQIMREKCDLKIPCETCATKDRRKFPKMCIRAHFDWESRRSMYFPDELTCRLKQDKLFQYLSSSSFTVSSRPTFSVPLNINTGKKLYVLVKEFTSLQHSTRHAHRAVHDDMGKRSTERAEVWSPPIIMFIRDGELPNIVKGMRIKLLGLFSQVLSDEKPWIDWTMKYFHHEREDFQCTVIGWIGKYYRKDIEEHSILMTALSLLWFEYLLLNKFSVAKEDIESLEAHLEARRTPAQANLAAIPDTINRFLKAIILPLAIDVAKRLTEALHERLFKMAVSQKFSQAGTDIVMCLMFVLMVFMGGTQSTLLLLADTPGEEIDMEYNLESAKAKILEIDEAIVELWTSFHKYTLGRRATASVTKASLSAKEAASPAEVHAREFNLIAKMKQEIEHDYGTLLPPTLAQLLLSCNARRQHQHYQQQHHEFEELQQFDGWEQLLPLQQQQQPPLMPGRFENEADWVFLSVDSRPQDLDVGANGGFELDEFRILNIARLCWKVWANVDPSPSAF